MSVASCVMNQSVSKTFSVELPLQMQFQFVYSDLLNMILNSREKLTIIHLSQHFESATTIKLTSFDKAVVLVLRKDFFSAKKRSVSLKVLQQF